MALEIGANLGRYRVLQRIGRGGLATVYRGLDPGAAREVALKVLPRAVTGGAEFAAHFEREAHALERLRHYNVVSLIDHGHEGGHYYLVTELVEGGTLASRLGEPMPVAEVHRVLNPISRALDYAHDQGILHLDVKPSNILLAADGTPVLADFGRAVLTDPAVAFERGSLLIGTPQYMAPEAFDGEPGPRTDQYALGVVAYQMLTGTLPADAPTPAGVAISQVEGSLRLPREVQPGVSAEVEAVLLKALAREARDRYRGCEAFVGALLDAERASQGGRLRIVE